MRPELVRINWERGGQLGIMVGSLMKMLTLCAVAVKKSNSMLGVMRKGNGHKIKIKIN